MDDAMREYLRYARHTASRLEILRLIWNDVPLVLSMKISREESASTRRMQKDANRYLDKQRNASPISGRFDARRERVRVEKRECARLDRRMRAPRVLIEAVNAAIKTNLADL
jgi:hypothetical protein